MSNNNNTFAALNNNVMVEGNEVVTTNVVKDEVSLDTTSSKSSNVGMKPSANGILGNVLGNINSLQELEILSNVIAESTIHKGVFGKNGELSKESVMTSLVVGSSIGLTLLESLSLGKELNSDTVAKIALGRNLNIPAMIARQHIHKINDVYAVDYHIINAIMNKAGVKRKIVRDYQPINLYKIVKTNMIVKFDSELFFLVYNGMDTNVAKENLSKGKRAVEQFTTAFETEIEFTRDRLDTLTFSYSTQDAVEAELLNGVKADGSVVKGKAPWNLHTKTMLRKQVVSIAKEVIADLLYGTLTTVELGYDNDIHDVTEYTELQ
jgi:hypothetical protein